MKFVFNLISTISLRFRWITILLVAVLMVTGIAAAARMNQELLPPIEFPQSFILAPAPGMTSEQVLSVVTERIEAEVNNVEDIINIESTTTGAFGAVITAYNDFGLDQDRLRDDIQAAIDRVWLPLRRIAPAEDEDPEAFAAERLAELTPDVLIYIAENDPNFLFRLSSDVWESFSAETVEQVAAYLAQQVETATVDSTALERLVEKEIVPQLVEIDTIVDVNVDGGQSLPGEEDAFGEQETETQQVNQLLRLSPEVRAAIASKLDSIDTLDEDTVETLASVNVDVPASPPALPGSWNMDRFETADDLLEITTLTSPISGIFNDFEDTGRIVGAIGRTDDLTPEIVTQLLEIEPTLVQYLEGDQLVAMSQDVFAALPDEFVANLDGFTRDELAAAALAQSITGEETVREPVLLPDAWRIPPAQIRTFSAADFPLVVYSIKSTGEIVTSDVTEGTDDTETPIEETTDTEGNALGNVIQGLAPVLGSILGGGNEQANPSTDGNAVDQPLGDAWSVLSSQPQFADNPLMMVSDLVEFGDGQASSVLNTINENIPDQYEGYEVRLFDSLTQDRIAYLVEQEANFYENLSTDVLLKFNSDVLASLPEDFVESLESDAAEQINAIATGEQDSAFAALQALYATDIAPADPNAPALNAGWLQLANFEGIELDTADDFFRFPPDFQADNFADYVNNIFLSPQGANFARNNNLLEDMPTEVVEYLLERDPATFDALQAIPLSEFSEENLALLSDELQQRATETGERFVPENAVTRTDRSPSLFVTVFKDIEANTVTSFHKVNDLLTEIDEADENIEIDVIFEQSSFIEESISGVAREGGLGAVFAIIIILIFLSSGTWAMGGRRTVGFVMLIVFSVLLVALVASGLDSAGNNWGEAFNQTDIVFRVLLIGGILAGFVVLLWPSNLPDPAWRSTVVIGVSIPLSIMTAFALMFWLSPAMHEFIAPLAEDSAFFEFVLRLFPEELTLNIMTLSGLTVAIGRVVDDSIVVLENIFRQVQAGGDKREAVLSGTRDVSAAIFVATMIAVVVFLPLGLTGGLIGAFFLPFGLAVTYALAASFVVAITVVPVLAYLMIDETHVPEEGDIWVARYYLPILKWSLRNGWTKFAVIVMAFLSMMFGFFLLSQRPFAFLPNFGEPQIAIAVSLPTNTNIIETNELVVQLEDFIVATVPEEQLTTIQTTIGGGGTGFEDLFGSGGVSENVANLIVGLDVTEDELDDYTQIVREEANRIFGDGNSTVSAASVADGGFGGFALIVSGPVEELREIDPVIIETLNGIEGITNVSSNFSEGAANPDEGSVTYIRVNLESAISYSAELETEDTIGITQEAITVVEELPEISDNITVSQGFQSETQTEGFLSLFTAMGIAFMIVVVILIFTLTSPVYWLAIVMSIVVAPVGAAVALTLADRVLGISALIGMLMLLGLVITNAVVLIDRVQSNLSERGMNLYDALIEAGGRRLLMTSLATIIAPSPLAIGLSEGAIIASELGTVVIGGVISSMFLTLVVVPVVYSLLHPVHRFFYGLFGIKAVK